MRGDILSGEVFIMEPGVDFVPTAQMLVDVVEDDEHDPWEYEGSVVLNDYHPAVRDPRFPHAAVEQGWSALVLALSQMCKVLGVDKQCFQLNQYDPETGKPLGTRFTIQAKTPFERKL